jgi:hypothetical protein
LQYSAPLPCLSSVQTQDLFEANKEMANRLMRAEEESQFRLTELQTELDSVGAGSICWGGS